MDQRKLYRTIETVASKTLASDEELLAEVVEQIISNEQIKLTGGRIWKLNVLKILSVISNRKSFRLVDFYLI